MNDPIKYEGWIAIFSTSTDFEADLVRDRLDAEGVDAVVLTQRDHTFNLNVGDMAPVHVMVQPADVGRARAVIESVPFTDAELSEAAMNADPNAADAHPPDTESLLDSGLDRLSLSAPEEDRPEDDRTERF
jgi:hypothetical protein